MNVLSYNVMGDGFLSIFKSRCVILKTQEYRENDKLVWLFSEKLGKISSIARRAKKGNSNLGASTLPFCFGEYVLYRGKSLYTINEALIIDSFQDLMGDLDTLTYCSYFNELIDISLPDEESNRELFKELVTAYYLVKNKVGDIEILARAFEIKLLYATGYGLNLDYCSKCRKKIKKANAFDIHAMGVVCEECNRFGSIKITNTTYNILRYLTNLSLEKVHRIVVDENTKSELYMLSSSIISTIYSRKPKSLEIFNYLKKE